MANEPYWVKRERNNIKREEMRDEEVFQEVKRIIERAKRESIRQINDFYAKYAGKEGLTKAEAQKRVSQFDVQEFQATAKQYVKERNFSDKANKELKLYNTKMKVSRQKLLMMYLNLYLVAMADAEVTQYHSRLVEVMTSEVARQAGILGEHINISSEKVEAIVGASFHHHTWSTRIWNDMKGLRKELDRIINQNIIAGEHPNKFVPDLKERFGVTTYEAKRLLQTEAARVQTEAMRLNFLKIGGPDAYYKFVAKLDERTTKICRGLNGEEFKVKDMMPSVNAAPMHPFCRSSAVLLPPKSEDGSDWRKDFFEKRKGKYSGLDVNIDFE